MSIIQVMCVQYWPGVQDKVETYSGIEVSYTYEEPLANFVMRSFKLKNTATVS